MPLLPMMIDETKAFSRALSHGLFLNMPFVCDAMSRPKSVGGS